MANDPSRRQALAITGLGALATVVGGVGTWRSMSSDALAAASGGGDDLREPEVLASSGGALEVTLTAAPGVTLAGRHTGALGYNSSSPGPTLLVRPGDNLRVRLHNRLDAATNLHTHGLHVSPEGLSDNIFRSIGPDASADYEYRIPDDHPTGTFWYHPHRHGTVADQVFGGLLGALLVVGSSEPAVDRDRVLLVSDTTLTSSGDVAGASNAQLMAGREGELVLVNGQDRPRIDLPAGAVERWRIVNTCISRFLDLKLDGHTLGLMGHDGQALQPRSNRSSWRPGTGSTCSCEAPRRAPSPCGPLPSTGVGWG